MTDVESIDLSDICKEKPDDGFDPRWLHDHFRIDRWRCATNGHMLVAVRDDKVSAPVLEGETAERIETMLVPPVTEPFQTVRSALKLWAGHAFDPCPCDGEQKSCFHCDGAGVVDCVCSHCNDRHEADCDDCYGEGIGRCPDCGTQNSPATGKIRDLQPGRLVGKLVDRRKVARALDVWDRDDNDDGQVLTIWPDVAAHNRVFLRWGPCHAVIMGLQEGEKETAPPFPSFPEQPEPSGPYDGAGIEGPLGGVGA